MKKIITSVLLLSLILGTCMLLGACGDNDGFIDYIDCNLKFRLPDYFRKRSVQGLEIMFSTTGATFEVQVMPKEEIEDAEYQYEFDFDITVEEYAEFFIEENEWTDVEYKYDKERDVATMDFYWTPSEEIGYGYYYIVILKNEGALYCAVYSCEDEYSENYKPLFREWASYLEAVD